MSSSLRAVLIVDDSADTLEMYAIALSQAGYRPLTATDAESALLTLRSDPPNAVVTDLQFPRGIGGWGLIQELKNDAATREIPVIVLTGRTEPSIVADAQHAGCAAVVTKPCLPDDLARVIRQILPGGGTAAA